MHVDYISANSTPTLQSFHPPELNSLRYRHLQHPIVLVIFAVANHNTVHANERRNLTEAVLFLAVATALFRRIHPPAPVEVRGRLFRFLLQREDKHIDVIASLEVI